MSNELAIRAVGVQITTVNDLARIANMMADSGYFEDARDAAQAAVKIMAGQGWGIAPFDAMSGIHVIKGKPSVGAGLMAAKVKGSGRYDYRVREMSETACRIEFFEGTESLGISSFTIAEAKLAGTQNLTKFPRNMLFARAMSNGVKWFTPDVFNSPVYVPEELGATVDGDGNIIDVESRVSRPSPTLEQAPQADTPEETPEGHDDRLITPSQTKALAIAIKDCAFGMTEDGKQKGRQFVSWLGGLPEAVASIKDLTAEAAAVALDRIGSGENGAYRTSPELLANELTAWHEHLDYQRSVNANGEPEAAAPGLPDFDPNERPGKSSKAVKNMEPINADEQQEAIS